MLAADTYLSSIRADSEALAAAAREGGLDADVVTCPGWKMHRLVGHMGTVFNWAGATVRQANDAPADRAQLDRPPDDDGVIGWFEDKAESILDTLRNAGTESTAWNFTDTPRTSDFWHRRMAHEAAVHRVDAEFSAGKSSDTITAMDPRVAADGVDEFLTRMTPDDAGEKLQGTIHFHCTDTDGEWLLKPGADGVAVTREHAKGDVAVRGRAQDLLLLVWNRLGSDAAGVFEVFGDEQLLRTWLDAVRR